MDRTLFTTTTMPTLLFNGIRINHADTYRFAIWVVCTWFVVVVLKMYQYIELDDLVVSSFNTKNWASTTPMPSLRPIGPLWVAEWRVETTIVCEEIGPQMSSFDIICQNESRASVHSCPPLTREATDYKTLSCPIMKRWYNMLKQVTSFSP